MTKYNEFTIRDDDWETQTATVTDQGVYFDHSMSDGEQFISHEDFEKLNEFREEFLDEIQKR